MRAWSVVYRGARPPPGARSERPRSRTQRRGTESKPCGISCALKCGREGAAQLRPGRARSPSRLNRCDERAAIVLLSDPCGHRCKRRPRNQRRSHTPSTARRVAADILGSDTACGSFVALSCWLLFAWLPACCCVANRRQRSRRIFRPGENWSCCALSRKTETPSARFPATSGAISLPRFICPPTN